MSTYTRNKRGFTFRAKQARCQNTRETTGVSHLRAKQARCQKRRETTNRHPLTKLVGGGGVLWGARVSVSRLHATSLTTGSSHETDRTTKKKKRTPKITFFRTPQECRTGGMRRVLCTTEALQQCSMSLGSHYCFAILVVLCAPTLGHAVLTRVGT